MNFIERENNHNYLNPSDTYKQYLSEKGFSFCDLDNATRILPPVKPQAMATIVTGAYNETENIKEFIQSITWQHFSYLSPENFEVLIIPNNCTDDTTVKAKYWRQQLKPKIATYILEKNFPPETAGIGNVRKFGCDLTLNRLLQTSNPNRPYYFINLDTDVPFPPDHLEKIILTFWATKADALSGTTDYLDIGKYLHIGTPNWINLYKLYVNYLRNNHVDGNMNTTGCNSAIKATSYAMIGGFEPLKVGEDTNLYHKLLKLQAKIVKVKSTIHQNPRRLLANPLAFVTKSTTAEWTKAYEKHNFVNTEVRQLPTPLEDLTKEEIAKFLNNYINTLMYRPDIFFAKEGSEDPPSFEKIASQTMTNIKRLGLNLKF